MQTQGVGVKTEGEANAEEEEEEEEESADPKKTKSKQTLDGEEGIAKQERGYSWTQTREEVELIVPLSSTETLTSREAKARGLKVKFFPKKITVDYEGKALLKIVLYSSVDVDGCAWTWDSSSGKGTNLVLNCEKTSGRSWPRIMLDYNERL